MPMHSWRRARQRERLIDRGLGSNRRRVEYGPGVDMERKIGDHTLRALAKWRLTHWAISPFFPCHAVGLRIVIPRHGFVEWFNRGSGVRDRASKTKQQERKEGDWWLQKPKRLPLVTIPASASCSETRLTAVVCWLVFPVHVRGIDASELACLDCWKEHHTQPGVGVCCAGQETEMWCENSTPPGITLFPACSGRNLGRQRIDNTALVPRSGRRSEAWR
jgi:hypothetical protein